MIDWRASLVEVGDSLLGWTLGWPRDLTLIIVAGITAAVLLTIRRVIVPRDRLRCIAEDERRLKELLSEARLRGDTEGIGRYRHVRRLVAGKRLPLELLPAVLGLLPALVIITWGAERLDHLPLRRDQTFEFSVTLPASAVGSIAHVVPQPGLVSITGWIRPVELTSEQAAPLGRAAWQLRATSDSTVDHITLRHGTMTWEHPIVIGDRRPPPETVNHGSDAVTQVHLNTYRPFGFVPGIVLLGLRPWLVGLLALTVGAYLGAKHLCQMMVSATP